MRIMSEIYLTENYVFKESWGQLIEKVSTYNGYFKKWKLIITFEGNKVRYYLNTKCLLPPSINGLKSFLLKQIKLEIKNKKSFSIPYIINSLNNIIDIKNHFEYKKDEKLQSIELDFRKITNNKIINSIKVKTQKNLKQKQYKIFFKIPEDILSIDYESNYNLSFKSAPKYLDISKCIHLLENKSNTSLLKIDPFPYLHDDYYINQSKIDFNRHSIVFGASGSGKSKFLSSLIENIYKLDEFKSKYKVVVIDPHASLENDIGGLGNVIDFKTNNNSINLFLNNSEDTIVSLELLLDIFKGLIPNNYNAKLERVLRHSLYLLLVKEIFNFSNLRNLLLDSEFRSGLITETESILPPSIITFFLSEFNEIKTKSYVEAISPIIAFIDEMEMIPVFDKISSENNLYKIINDNFLTIFSLDRTKLGSKVTKTISGLVMQQLFTLVQNHSFNEHIIFVVDEVAIIENPILIKFLAEARKYNLSLILAGQHFNGITENLKKSIFANVINYYIFRVSKEDADELVDNITIKIPLKDTEQQKVKLITELQDRQCIVRISNNGILMPAMKGETLNFSSIPRIINNCNIENKKQTYKTEINRNFNINTKTSLKDILISNSTSRKDVKNER